MADQARELEALERILIDASAEPVKLSYTLIKLITKDFSEEIGRGGYGVVYLGVLRNERVAVKKLSVSQDFSDKNFEDEVKCLMRAKHKNIVRFLGYCADTQGEMMLHNGTYVLVEVRQRLLCFEYVPNGNLQRYLQEKPHGDEWYIRYRMIKGICQGLHYLHEERINHLDLKPQNVLLDGHMEPKIADFGLSRCFDEEQSRIFTKNIIGSPGYIAPELIDKGEISFKSDIFSLGMIIIKLLTGRNKYDIENWHKSLDIDCPQMKRCIIDIAQICVDADQHNRPTIGDVIHKLNEMETVIQEVSPVIYQELAGRRSDMSDAANPPGVYFVGRPLNHEEQQAPRPIDEQNDVMARVPAQMTVAVHLALTKIGSVFGDDASKSIIDKLSGKVTKLKELLGKVKQIRRQLTMMSNVMRQIGRVYLTDEFVKSWIGEVRNVAYHVEDVMDKCSYHLLQPLEEGFLNKFFTKGRHYVLVFREIADEVAEVEKEIQEVIQMKDQWLQSSQLVPNQLTEIERQQPQDCFPEFVTDEDLVGIKENRKLLTGWLYSEEPDSTVIIVSGRGGLGKTTLVTNVYEREKVNFPAHAWIIVSQIYTVDALLRKLLRRIGYKEEPLPAGIDEMDIHDLKEEIKKILKNSKCLIVLDDVWELKVYIQIHDAFQNLLASRIIITTRKDHVAALASSTRLLELQPLGKSDAFELFCRRAFYNKGHKCPKEFETIATSIVDRCHGLPLAIVTIGSLLSLRPRIDVWNHTYNQLQRELSNNDHVRAIANLSYHYLPGELKSCFLYCTLFPVGYPISRESLVRLWVAEGFVLSKEKNTPEEVAEGNLMELIHRNMIEVVDNDELGRVNTCKMHDIMRDLALSVAREERFGSANDYGTMVLMDRAVRRLSSCGWKDTTALKVKFPRLRTLMAHGIISSSPDMLSSVLSESSYLTVLELQDSEITEVPASIGNLFNLRYIGLRRTKVKSLPESIEKLSNLLTLDIKQTKIEKLPRGIVKVKKLRHLLADRFANEKQSEFRYFVGVEPPKGLFKLEELQTLETVQASKDLAEQLKKLMQLRSIWIDNVSAADCANLFATLSMMPLLSSLLLSASDVNETLCFETLKPTKLHRLIVRGRWAAGTLECPIFHKHGEHLKYLALGWCQLGEDPLGVLAQLVPNLTYLSLNRVNSAKTLVLSAGCFPHLKTLVLKRMPNVNEMEIVDGALPCIEGVYIVFLSELDKVPRGIETLLSLKKLWLLGLHKDFKSQWLVNGMHQKMRHVPVIRI